MIEFLTNIKQMVKTVTGKKLKSITLPVDIYGKFYLETTDFRTYQKYTKEELDNVLNMHIHFTHDDKMEIKL